MKIAIAYTTKNGTTRECAEYLAHELDRFDTCLFDIEKDKVDIDEFDAVAVGFPIRMARPVRAARDFLQKNAEALEKKPHGIFICCGFIDCFDEYAQKLKPRSLAQSAFAVSCFGGSLDPKRAKGIDRLIVRAVRNDILGGGNNGDERQDMSLPTLLESNIVQFADELKKLFD